MTTGLDIQPLTPERFPDLAALFEQGGDPKWCWCAYFRVRGVDFSAGSGARHRKVLETATKDTERERRGPGLVAYRDGTVVGWVSVGPREDYERLAHSRVLAPVDEKPVWSIVCFVVGRQARGQGVAKELLKAAVAYARDHGASILEAYPIDLATGERTGSDLVYKGTLSMFEAAGFTVVARRNTTATTPPRPIVRRSIRPRRASA